MTDNLLVVDENIPLADEIFSKFGTVKKLPGRNISKEDLQNASALIIRSVSKVNRSTLEGTAVKFVGTCTIGVDHVNQKDLQDLGVQFESAPGCNAQAVAEYVITNLLLEAKQNNKKLKGASIGIIGVGNVGKIVQKYAKAIGMNILLNDPPRAQVEINTLFHSLTETLSADYITLHVPYEKQGPHPTHHLINEKTLSQVPSHSIIINSCRGEVIDNKALKTALINKKIGGAILDVWEKEPIIDAELLDQCIQGSPHVAGYTFDAKIRGATMIAEKLAQFKEIPFDADPFFQQIQENEELSVNCQPEDADEHILLKACLQFFDPKVDTNSLKQSLETPNPSKSFDDLRKNYRKRREFQCNLIAFKGSQITKELERILNSLNFKWKCV